MAKVGRLVKESFVSELSAHLAEQPNFFITSINRLPAADADALRQKLSSARAQLIVTKRRLSQRVLEGLSIEGLRQLLQGSVALVLTGDDVLQVAKLIVEFRKTHEGQLSLAGGLIDGQLLSESRIEELAQLPPRPILLAQVVATIESPLAGLVLTIEQLIGDVAWIAEQAAEKKPAAPTPPAPSAPAAQEAPQEAPSAQSPSAQATEPLAEPESPNPKPPEPEA